MSVQRAANGDLTWVTPSGTIYYAGGELSNCTLPECPVELSVYGYRASLPFSSIAIAFYGLVIAAQVFLGLRYKTWSFMSAMLAGCICEIIGYVGRIMMWENPWNHSGFIMQIVLITIAPVFFSAAIYVMLYQIAVYISPSSSRFSPSLFYWILIPCDVISLILQGVGGGMSATSNGSSNAGVNIALAGLAFQVATLVFFIVAVADYMIRSKTIWRATTLPKKFKIFSLFLTLATIFILLRCCYRVYELSEGYSRDSEALRDQPLFIALEGVMVILAAICLVVAHPGPVFRNGEKSIAEQRGEIETSHEKKLSNAVSDSETV